MWTAAFDCGTISLWTVLWVCYFPEQPLSLSFHPTGLQLLVGFADKLRLCSVLLGEVRAYKEFAIKGCCECAFSHGGHLFAAVNGTLVQVYDTNTGEQLAVFRGHTASSPLAGLVARRHSAGVSWSGRRGVPAEVGSVSAAARAGPEGLQVHMRRGDAAGQNVRSGRRPHAEGR